MRKKNIDRPKDEVTPARTVLYTIRSARESQDKTDIVKYSLYLPVQLFQELDRDADDSGRTVNQHITYILQLAYGHVRHDQMPRWTRVEGLFDKDNDDFRFPD